MAAIRLVVYILRRAFSSVAMLVNFERGIALLLLANSFVGSVLAMNANTLWPADPLRVGIGLAIQGAITVIEWIYPVRVRLSAANGTAVIIGTFTTLAGYGPLLAPSLQGVLDAIPGAGGMMPVVGQTAVTLATWLILTVLAYLNEVVPEHILVEH